MRLLDLRRIRQGPDGTMQQRARERRRSYTHAVVGRAHRNRELLEQA